MILRNLVSIILLLALSSLTACNRIEEKAKKAGEKIKSEGKQLVEKVVDKVLPDEEPAVFSIRSIVKDFAGDSGVKEIKGIQAAHNFLFVEYCVYKAQKNRVIRGVNKIAAKNTGDYNSDEKCYEVPKEDFYKAIAPDEKDAHTAFFWNFERLKKYEIYTCTKAPLRHFIIFDKNSDTVYHRIEELAN
jgi:predicted small secreted protein